jgi:hypothetical protein
MNEFGETPSVYLWPKDHEEGGSYPEDFWDRVSEGLKSVGIEWETV